MNRILAITVALCVACMISPPSQSADCTALARLKLPNTRIIQAVSVTGGALELPAPPGGEAPKFTGLPPFCRVAGVIAPAADSRIGFEVWLPIASWNQRYQQVGNGGFAGSVPYPAMAAALRRGYATAGTDDGHEGAGPQVTWALKHPEKVVDYGYRAVHSTTVVAKAIAGALYGRPARHSYFAGCSDGGREGLMEAQRFPEDFDGWLLGAPANNFTGVAVGFLHVAQVVSALKDPLTDAQLGALSEAALARCDAADGVKDGVLTQPLQCAFDPRELECTAAPDGRCLTHGQVDAVRKLYEGLRDEKSGAVLAPGLHASLGAEAAPYQWPIWVTGSLPLFGPVSGSQYFAENLLRYFVYEDPALDFRKVDPIRALEDARSRVGATLNALDPDLSVVRARGKKVIQYHGGADAAIPPEYSTAYYEAVESYLGHSNRDFYRLFLVPGMGHCSDGPGPNIFNAGENTGAPVDSRHDLTSALEKWVEEGVAPESVIATKFTDNDGGKALVRTGLLCPYPEVAQWTGQGSTDRAESFACRPAPTRPGVR